MVLGGDVENGSDDLDMACLFSKYATGNANDVVALAATATATTSCVISLVAAFRRRFL